MSFRTSASEAMESGFVPATTKNGLTTRSLSFTDTYKYPNAEAIITVNKSDGKEVLTLVHFKSDHISVDASTDGRIRKSTARRVVVSLLKSQLRLFCTKRLRSKINVMAQKNEKNVW